MSWYRIYRPQNVQGLHVALVRAQLLSFMKVGEFPHAVLLTGPKGTGKTSSARIIAKVINCELNVNAEGKAFHDACLKCESCTSITTGSALNVIEIDAASHRRIDDVRELREQIYLPPVTGAKNVYIIDEVHMMTNEAFNALLKILEEPPSHAMFILATTEAHKIPETILSRSTIIQFQKPSSEELTQTLQQIAAAEKITIAEPKILQNIIKNAQGSFRDAVKVFEQIARGKKTLNLADVSRVSGAFGDESILELLGNITAKDEMKIIDQFQEWKNQDLDSRFLQAQILETLHTQLLMSLGIKPGKSFASSEIIMFLLKTFNQVVIDERAPLPLLPLEICAIEMVLKSKQQAAGSKSNSSQAGSRPTETRSKPMSSPIMASISTQTPSSFVVQVKDEPVSENRSRMFTDMSSNSEITGVNQVSDVHGTQLQENWNQFLQLIGQRNISIEALLRSTQFLEVQPGKVVLKVFYGFHKEQLELDRYRLVLEECASVLLGQTIRFEFILDSAAKARLQDEGSNISGQVEDSSLAKLAEEILV